MATAQFNGKSLRLVPLDNGIVELVFDREGESVNKFDSATIAELSSATAALRADSGVKGVLVTSAKTVFIVGADIFEFTTLFARTQEQIEAHVAHTSSVFTAFEDLPVPTVSAINGFAFGGGLEMALCTDARVMAEDTQIGVPEVSLGLFPGFGGTVRLPRVSNAQVGVDWVSTGKPQSAKSALAAGVVDEVVAPDALRDASLKLLQSLIASGEWQARRKRRTSAYAADAAVFANAKQALGKTAALQPAPLAAVEMMELAAPLSRDEALKLEASGFAKIARTQAAASMIQLFINDQLVKKKGKAYAKAAKAVKSAAVLGAGIMGGGIAYTSAVRKVPIVMKDIAQNALDLGMSEARKLTGKQVETGRMKAADAEKILASIRPTLDYAGFESVDVVVEAVVENMKVKKAVLAEVEARVDANTIIASNTSSLSLAEMATVLKRPERFVGMHFFNPVHAMPLVEVIRTATTSEAAAATIASYASAMGKTPIVVKECPGFLVNRILTPYMLGFLRALHDGADYVAIDRVMEAFGWPMGPAYLEDVIGMDTLAHVLHVISEGFADRMQILFPNAVELMVEHKRLGQKSGAGFYRYERDPKGRPKKSVDPETAALLAGIQPGEAQAFNDEAIFDRLMIPLIIEAARCLEEGIAESAAEIDLSLVLGLGFPRYAGGPLKLADWIGLDRIVERAEKLKALGPLYLPTTRMREMAKSGAKYF